ncbi:hypothetical protein I2486_16090 [Cellulophaga sp. E16_2]|uniref:hypothetical protein n=1 Tax=Cellulophaga sp. E16_2 TaxID=2789297 RepID=UPI001A92CD83|nr:hypothetical protein [Cellulophaga sp. E16_2]MBO0592925.1 hypothetical protein [Cellulophaga sp. E16_2]
MKTAIIFLLLAIVSCNNPSTTPSVEFLPNEVLNSTSPTDLIKAMHRNDIRASKLTPNEASSSLILQYENEYLSSINISKEIDISEFMRTDNIKAKVVLYSFSLGATPFKNDIILIEDNDGNLKYKANYYISKYSDNREIKAIATIVENWTDGSTVYDYYAMKKY